MQSGGENKEKERGARGDEVVTFTRKEEELLNLKLKAREREERGIITEVETRERSKSKDEKESVLENEGEEGEKGWSVAVLTTDETKESEDDVQEVSIQIHA